MIIDASIEKRAFKRQPYKEPISFQFKNPSQFGGTVSYDISEGGLRLRMSEFVPVHTELTVQLQLPDQEVIECTGKIAWIEKMPFNEHYQAGIQFVHNESFYMFKQILQKFLHKNTQTV